MTVLEKLTVANVCFYSNDYAYDESPLITCNDDRIFTFSYQDVGSNIHRIAPHRPARENSEIKVPKHVEAT